MAKSYHRLPIGPSSPIIGGTMLNYKNLKKTFRHAIQRKKIIIIKLEEIRKKC